MIARLAAADKPMTAAEMLSALGGGLAYSTVVTTLTRLHSKGALTRAAHGRAFAYQLAGNADEAEASVTAFRMRKLLESGNDPASVLSRFVDALDPASERMLRSLFDEPGPHKTEPS